MPSLKKYFSNKGTARGTMTAAIQFFLNLDCRTLEDSGWYNEMTRGKNLFGNGIISKSSWTR